MHRKIFLIDSIGAFTSFSILLLFGFYSTYLRLPNNVVKILLVLPLIYSIYSLLVFLLNSPKWKLLLKIIALANFGYCLFTGFIVYKYYSTLTKIGLLYFITEMIIIIALAYYEYNLIVKKKNTQ
jgi:hypothetical protein